MPTKMSPELEAATPLEGQHTQKGAKSSSPEGAIFSEAAVRAHRQRQRRREGTLYGFHAEVYSDEGTGTKS